MQRDAYHSQLFTYYDGAKYGHDFDQVRREELQRHDELSDTMQQRLAHLQSLFAGRRILELACGLGFWTKYLAQTAVHITATDFSAKLIGVAGDLLPSERVEFRTADAFDLSPLPADYDAAFHFNFINHIPLAEWPALLDGLHARLQPGALVVMGGQGFQGEHQAADSDDFYSQRTAPDGQV